MSRKKRVVGTAGHIDHGKTSLVRALTGVDTDRLPEEKRRGITIDLGFASWFTSEYQIGFIDVPGHERFVKNTLAGVGGIDSALLVVAADESIKPQTREHFAICRLLGIPTGLVAITKSDLVDRDIIELVRLEIEDLVSGSFLEGKSIVPVSSTTGAGLDELREAILQSVASVQDRDATTRVFRLPIDRVFTMKGFGSVITGTTYSGSVRVEDEVEVLPVGRRSRARGVQVHGEPREEASAGERTSMNLADIALEDLRRGQQVLHPNTLRPSQIITARLELLADAKPLKEQIRIRFHHLSAELLGTIRFVDDTEGELRAGQAYVQIRLEAPVIAVVGDRFVIRRYSPAFTIGGGVILDAHLPKLSRGTRPEILETLASGSLPERVELMSKLEGLRGLPLDEIQSRTGIRREKLAKDLKRVPNVVVTGNTYLHHDVLGIFRKRAMELLDRYFKDNKMAMNVPKGEFIQKLIPAGAPVNFLLADLANQKIAVVQGDALDIPGRSKTLGGAEGELARMIESRFRCSSISMAKARRSASATRGSCCRSGARLRRASGRGRAGDAHHSVSVRRAQHRRRHVALRDRDHGMVHDALLVAVRHLAVIEHRKRARARERVVGRAHHRRERRRCGVAGDHHREQLPRDRAMLRELQLTAIVADFDHESRSVAGDACTRIVRRDRFRKFCAMTLQQRLERFRACGLRDVVDERDGFRLRVEEPPLIELARTSRDAVGDDDRVRVRLFVGLDGRADRHDHRVDLRSRGRRRCLRRRLFTRDANENEEKYKTFHQHENREGALGNQRLPAVPAGALLFRVVPAPPPVRVDGQRDGQRVDPLHRIFHVPRHLGRARLRRLDHDLVVHGQQHARGVAWVVARKGT